MPELNNMKEVYFDKFCYRCRHKDLGEAEDTCHDCLHEPARLNTHTPLNFDEDPSSRKIPGV